MLTGAGLAGVWHHTRAHRFFSAARWSVDQVRLALLEVIVRALVPPDAPIPLAVDDSLFKRQACQVRHGHPRPADQAHPRPLAVEQVCARYPNRLVHLVGDAAYIGRTWRDAPARLIITSRLRRDAALYELAPPRTGKPGRPRVKGKRLPELILLAGMTTVAREQTTACCYGRQRTLDLAVFRCLWYGALGAQRVQVMLAPHPPGADGYELAVIFTDLAATATHEEADRSRPFHAD
jgi:hypothetical protein